MKVIHCADIHLDSSLNTNLSSTKATIRNNEILQSFERLTIYAKENDVDLVLIAGDLFDQKYVSKNTLDLLFSFISSTSQILYFYVPGNHDEKIKELLTSKPSNLYVFHDNWETFELENITISSRTYDKNMVQSMPILSQNNFNIVILHGDIFNSHDPNFIDLNTLKNRNIDYLALGHIHSYQKGKLDSSGIYAYSGCLEGRGFDECGLKGFILLDTDSKQIEFIPNASRIIRQVEVDCSTLQSNYEIVQKLKSFSTTISQDDLVEFILTGSKQLDSFISISYIEQMIQNDFFYVRVKDERKLAIRKEDYQNDISLKGEFIRLVLNSDEEYKDQIIEQGIKALSGEKSL